MLVLRLLDLLDLFDSLDLLDRGVVVGGVDEAVDEEEDE